MRVFCLEEVLRLHSEMLHYIINYNSCEKLINELHKATAGTFMRLKVISPFTVCISFSVISWNI